MRPTSCQHEDGQPADVTVDALPGQVFKGIRDAGRRSGAAALHGHVATSQSTTGTEEAKDFKVVVTL
jgi:HlyD family secretion protein